MSTRKKTTPDTFSYQPFKDLKRLIECSKQQTPSKVPVPPRNPNASAPPAAETRSDEALFLSAMSDVREIKEFRELPVRPRQAAPPYRCTSADYEALKSLEEIASGKRPFNLPDTQEYVEWVNEDYHGDIARKLHGGQFAIQEYLDLHGLILEEAQTEVDRFLRDALARRLRCVKIIHGRGLRSPRGPVLKEAVVNWLIGRYKKRLIAFVSARQCDGGLGALYILLR